MNTLDIYFERGIEKGMEKGMEQGIEKGKEQIVQNLINSGKFTIQEIANLAGVPEAFVKRVNTFMKKKN